MEALVNMVLLTLMAVITVGIIRMRSLFGVAILAGIYSFLMASVMIALDAVDVAMTEASVGAGISTVLFLATLYMTRRNDLPSVRSPVVPLALSLVVGAALIYGTFELPAFGGAATPANTHIAPYYLQNSIPQTTVPNVVTSVLASYRGFDTFGETVVIFTAGLGILLLLRGRPRAGDAGDVVAGVDGDGASVGEANGSSDDVNARKRASS
ncbi:MAG: DUF4040 domain-containing protein [Pseudomonadota bacterium]